MKGHEWSPDGMIVCQVSVAIQNEAAGSRPPQMDMLFGHFAVACSRDMAMAPLYREKPNEGVWCDWAKLTESRAEGRRRMAHEPSPAGLTPIALVEFRLDSRHPDEESARRALAQWGWRTESEWLPRLKRCFLAPAHARVIGLGESLSKPLFNAEVALAQIVADREAWSLGQALAAQSAGAQEASERDGWDDEEEGLAPISGEEIDRRLAAGDAGAIGQEPDSEKRGEGGDARAVAPRRL
jgi:hypothetical protein